MRDDRHGAASTPPQLDLSKALQQATVDLESTDNDKAAVAAVTLAMLAQQADGQDPLLLAAVSKLTALIVRAAGALQRNACAALISIIQLGPESWQTAVDADTLTAAVSLMGAPKPDSGLQINGTVLAGALIEGHPSGPSLFFQAQGLEVLQPLLERETDAQLLEAAIDDVCKLASEPSARSKLIEAGMLETLAGLYGVTGQPETQLRALMGSAMLLSDSKERLKRLAETPGAVKTLAAIMRAATDADCRTLATRIFAGLANNEETKATVAAALQA